jgi:hypothetical protein
MCNHGTGEQSLVGVMPRGAVMLVGVMCACWDEHCGQWCGWPGMGTWEKKAVDSGGGLAGPAERSALLRFGG